MYRLTFFDSGTIWDIHNDDFRGHAGYWMKSALRDMKWFRYVFPEKCSKISICQIEKNGVYLCSIALSDVGISWLQSVKSRCGMESRFCYKRVD